MKHFDLQGKQVIYCIKILYKDRPATLHKFEDLDRAMDFRTDMIFWTKTLNIEWVSSVRAVEIQSIDMTAPDFWTFINKYFI